MKTRGVNLTSKLGIIKNQSGAALLIVVAIGSIIGTAAYISTSKIRNTQQEQGKLTDRNERDRIFNAVKSSFTMYNFCSQALDMKMGTFVSAGTKVIPTSLLNQYHITKLQNNYQLKDIRLVLDSTFTDPSDSIVFRNFKLEVNIEHKNPTLAQQLGSFVTKSYNKLGTETSEVFYITTSNKSHCIAHADSINTFSGLATNAGKQICNSLGSSSPSPNATICNIKEFGTKANGGIDTEVTLNNQSDFQDAFCDYELLALQRVGYHQTAATGKAHYGWTTLCRKPKWYGCTAGGVHTPTQTWTTDRIHIWDTNNGKKKKEVQEAMKNKAKELSEHTIERRKERVFTHLAYDDLDTSTVQNALWPHFVSNGSDGDALIAATGAFGAEAAVAYFGGAFMGPAGAIAFKLILSILGKGCDKTAIRVEYKCAEGYNEVNKVYFDYQKVSWKGLKRRCKWRNANTWKVPTELDIKNAVYNQWFNEAGAPVSEGVIVDALTHAEAKQYRDDINLVTSLYNLYTPPPISGEEFDLEESISMPAGLQDVFAKREAELWKSLHSSASGQLLSMINDAEDFKPFNPTSTKSCDDLKSFTTSSEAKIISIRDAIQQNIKHANSITLDPSGAEYGASVPVDIVNRAFNGFPTGTLTKPPTDIKACPDDATCATPPAGYTTAFTLPAYSISFNIVGHSSLKNLISAARSKIIDVVNDSSNTACGASFNPDIYIDDTAK